MLTRTYNADYELTGVETAPSSGTALLNEAFGWQTDGRIASVTDHLVPTMGSTSRTAAFTYSADGRVATADGPWGDMTLGFDANANLTAWGSLAYALKAGSNQMASASLSGVAQHTYSYTLDGELSQDVGTSTYAYSYNAARRMTEASEGGSETNAYAYDFAGHGVWNLFEPSTQTAITYDLAGHAQTFNGATGGTASREFVWLDDQLVGMVVWSGGTPSFYAVTTGQIDQPELITGPTGASAWSGYLNPLGNQATFGTSTQTIGLHYPGQWVQNNVSANGTSQNGMRDYQPYQERYLEPDPLGIDAGANPYAYVDGDPLNLTDPEGLAPRDKWFGYDNGDFKWWLHNCYKQQGDPDVGSREEMAEIYAEYEAAGSPPRGRCFNDNNPPPAPAGAPAPQPAPKPGCQDCERKAIVVVGAGLGAYVIYRCVRMIPSLFPPLWPTIPANAAIP